MMPSLPEDHQKRKHSEGSRVQIPDPATEAKAVAAERQQTHNHHSEARRGKPCTKPKAASAGRTYQ
eukprot:9957403-Prorocentrum_lima.AAC.1